MKSVKVTKKSTLVGILHGSRVSFADTPAPFMSFIAFMTFMLPKEVYWRPSKRNLTAGVI